MTDSQGPRLLSEGDPIQLANGHAVTIRFSFRSLVRLEESFGSFAEMEQALQGRQMDGVLKLLAAGLLHEHDGQGAPLIPDRLGDLLPLTNLSQVMGALEVAMRRDFPTQPQAAAPATAGAPEAPNPLGLPSSPGTTGSTPAPSPSVALLASSGA